LTGGARSGPRCSGVPWHVPRLRGSRLRAVLGGGPIHAQGKRGARAARTLAHLSLALARLCASRTHAHARTRAHARTHARRCLRTPRCEHCCGCAQVDGVDTEQTSAGAYKSSNGPVQASASSGWEQRVPGACMPPPSMADCSYSTQSPSTSPSKTRPSLCTAPPDRRLEYPESPRPVCIPSMRGKRLWAVYGGPAGAPACWWAGGGGAPEPQASFGAAAAGAGRRTSTRQS
jgi:hypothetical protein